MKTLADVEFEDFLAWLGAIEGMDKGIKDDLMEAATTVPLIERLMATHANAVGNKASKRDLLRSSAIINSLVAVHFILKGRARPGSSAPSARRKVSRATEMHRGKRNS